MKFNQCIHSHNAGFKKSVIFLLLVTFNLPAIELELTLSESKAHYTFEVVKQIEWPNEKNITQFTVGFVGNDREVFKAFEERQSTLVRGKSFVIERFNEALFKSGHYDLIYIVNNRRSLNEALFEASANSLIVADGRVKASERMVSLIETRDSIRIRFNRDNLSSRGFLISANLLEFAGTKEDLTEELREREISLKKMLSEVSEKEKKLSLLNEKLQHNMQLLIAAENKLKNNNETIIENQRQLNQLRSDIELSNQSIHSNIQDISHQKELIKVKQQEIQQKKLEVTNLLRSIDENQEILDRQVSQIEQQKDTIENKDETITEQREWMIAILIVSIVFLIMTYFLWKTNRLRRKANQELKQLNSKLYELATTDGLTDLYNRRFFLEATQKELLREKRNDFHSVLLMIDIDHFKSVNDTYGHPMGDEVIRSVANILKQGMRKYDIVGRLGGEEYAMLLMDCHVEQATEIAHRLCDQVAKYDIFCEGRTINVTVSIGLSELDPQDTKIEQTIVRADKALYAAKDGGRNMVVAYQ